MGWNWQPKAAKKFVILKLKNQFCADTMTKMYFWITCTAYENDKKLCLTGFVHEQKSNRCSKIIPAPQGFSWVCFRRPRRMWVTTTTKSVGLFHYYNTIMWSRFVRWLLFMWGSRCELYVPWLYRWITTSCNMSACNNYMHGDLLNYCRVLSVEMQVRAAGCTSNGPCSCYFSRFSFVFQGWWYNTRFGIRRRAMLLWSWRQEKRISWIRHQIA